MWTLDLAERLGLTNKGNGSVGSHRVHLSTLGNTGGTEQAADDEHDESGACGREEEQLSSTDSVDDEGSGEGAHHRDGGIDQVELSLTLRIRDPGQREENWQEV